MNQYLLNIQDNWNDPFKWHAVCRETFAVGVYTGLAAFLWGLFFEHILKVPVTTTWFVVAYLTMYFVGAVEVLTKKRK